MVAGEVVDQPRDSFSDSTAAGLPVRNGGLGHPDRLRECGLAPPEASTERHQLFGSTPVRLHQRLGRNEIACPSFVPFQMYIVRPWRRADSVAHRGSIALF